MELQEYTTMFAAEDTHWWYRGLHELVGYFIHKNIAENSGVRLLDAGCGTGGLLKFLGAKNSFGIDLSPAALSYCRVRGLDGLSRGSLETLPFADGSFGVVVSLDVLYHAGVGDDLAALRELSRVLAAGGTLILNLPAFEFLRSSHDRALHTRNRYTVAGLKDKLNSCGMAESRVYYRNSLLFPAIAALRLLKKITDRESGRVISDIKEAPPLVNRLLLNILRTENKMMLKGLALPFGSSVFAVSRKM